MRKKIIISLLTFLVLFASFTTEARRGCCSHHGGVDHCDRDRGVQVCRDGSDSPSCGC